MASLIVRLAGCVFFLRLGDQGLGRVGLGVGSLLDLRRWIGLGRMERIL